MRIVYTPTIRHWSAPRRRTQGAVFSGLLALLRLLARARGAAAGIVREWRRRSRDRAQLAMLDDRMLRDIGITRADVWRECNKPFWRD
jgi:uncharacterized protein YjiS (DUF1127 family)